MLPKINKLHYKCHAGIAMIRIGEGKICRITASCGKNKSIKPDYTCIDQQSHCKKERLYLNGEFEGYRNDSLSISTFKSIISRPVNETIDLEILSSMGICSIDMNINIYECVNSIQAYGPIVYLFLSDGKLLVSPHITPKLNLYFSPEDPNFYQCNFPGCLEEGNYADCTGDHEYCKKLNKKCNLASSKRCKIMKGSIGYKTIDDNKLNASIILWQFYSIDMDRQAFLNLGEAIIGQRSG